MNQYHIRVDGELSTNCYTYQELVDMGLFELEADSLNGIEAKNITKSKFTPLKSYCFPELQSNEGKYHDNEYDKKHGNNTSQSNYHNGSYVDEFGRIVRPNSSSGFSYNFTSTSSSSSSSPDSTYSSGSDGWTTFWRIIGTIIVIGLVIAISAGTDGYATPVAVGGYYAIRAIWKDD